MTVLSNTALDLIFEPRAATTKRADVSLQTLGVDLANRYMDVAQGGTATAATTNIRSSGVDIATIFAQIGTVVVGAFALEIAATLTSFDSVTPTANSVANNLFTQSGTNIPPHSYIWSRVSGSTQLILTNSTSKFPTWTTPTATGVYNAVWRCQITDSTLPFNQVVFSNDCSIALRVVAGSGGA
jgi:hypothetical protein